jgi:hypothetical protein
MYLLSSQSLLPQHSTREVQALRPIYLKAKVNLYLTFSHPVTYKPISLHRPAHFATYLKYFILKGFAQPTCTLNLNSLTKLTDTFGTLIDSFSRLPFSFFTTLCKNKGDVPRVVSVSSLDTNVRNIRLERSNTDPFANEAGVFVGSTSSKLLNAVHLLDKLI